MASRFITRGNPKNQKGWDGKPTLLKKKKGGGKELVNNLKRVDLG